MSWRARKGWLPSCATKSVSSRRGNPSRFMRSVASVVMACCDFAASAARVQLGGTEEVGDLAGGGVGGIGAVHYVLFDTGRKLRADGAWCRLLWIGGAHDVAVARDGVVAFQHLHDHGTGGHVTHQVLEERALPVNGIEALGFALGQLQHARGDDREAGLLEATTDLPDEIRLRAVRLDDRQGALERHSL